MKNLIAVSLIMLAGACPAQDHIVMWDTTFVVLDSADVDTVFVQFPNQPQKQLSLTRLGSTFDLRHDRPGDKSYMPDTLALMLDSTNVAGASADSFRISIVPVNPVTGALLTASVVYVRGTGLTFGTITDGLVLGLPRIFYWTTAYAILLERGDFNQGSQRVRASFLRLER